MIDAKQSPGTGKKPAPPDDCARDGAAPKQASDEHSALDEFVKLLARAHVRAVLKERGNAQ